MIDVFEFIYLLFVFIGLAIVVLTVGLPVLLKAGLEAWSEFIEKVKEYKDDRHN